MALASTNAIAPSLAFDRIQVTYPSPQANGVLSVRIDTRIKLLVSFRPGSPIQCLKIPKTPSVHGECPTPEQSLKFSLELRGAGSETIIRNICEKCKERKDQATWDMVDFRAPTTIIPIEDGTASIEFFIKCYARHHGKEHFCADAILRDYQDNVIGRTPLLSLFDISGRGKPVTPRRAQKRAVRGVAARHFDVAPCIIPAVPPSVNPSLQDPQHADNGTVQEWATSHLGNPVGECLQTSSSDQQLSWADTAAGILGATSCFFWYPPSTPVNAPPLSQHAAPPAELIFSSPAMGSLHHVDTLPLESNSNPVVYSGTRTSAPPHGEQILPVIPRENTSIPSSLGPTSGEPHYGRSMSRVPETTSQMLSQNSSGSSQAPNISSAVPSGQGTSAPDISTPSESSRLQAESSAHTRNEGVDHITGETLLEEVVPDKGPTTGNIQIILCGERFPASPLYVLFGDNWARARRHDDRILRCCLPPSAHPGVVNVTLSQIPSKNAPEVGRSIATFEYEESRPER